MTEYFDRFKDLQKKEQKELEVNTPLVERIKYHNKQIIFDGKPAFTSPLSEFKIMGILPYEKDSPYGRVYAGIGNCCHGHLFVFNAEKELELYNIFSIDTTVSDILPVTIKEGELPTEHAILIAGSGCMGQGVRMYNNENPVFVDLITKEEFRRLKGELKNIKLSFQCVPEDKSLRLSISGDSSSRTVILNEYLRPYGLDIDATLEKNKRFVMRYGLF